MMKTLILFSQRHAACRPNGMITEKGHLKPRCGGLEIR